MAKDILQLVSEKEEQANRNLRRGVIICPGAIGDCLLTLPLADFLKDSLKLGGVDFVGNTEYIDFYPGRTCIDSIKSAESIEFHRLFADSREFTVADHDPLISSFSRYECIVSFMGADDANFESNLIFTVSCSHPADITMLPLAGKDKNNVHVSEFYIKQFAAENGIDPAVAGVDLERVFLTAHKSDVERGSEILENLEIEPDDKLVVIHPGSGGERKCWHLDNYLSVADRLGTEEVQVLFLLGPAEQDRLGEDAIRRIQSTAACVCEKDLAEVLQILTWADCFVGNDSGVGHIAGALGVQTVAIFGPTDPSLYQPVGPHVKVLQPQLECFGQLSPPAVEMTYKTVYGILQD